MTARTFAPSSEKTGSVPWKQMSLDRAGALCGIVFVILTFIALAVSDPNSADVDANPLQDSAVIANLFTENRSEMELGMRFQIASLAFMLIFVAYLYQRIRSAEASRGWIATAVLGGGLAYVAVMLIFTAVGLAITSIHDYGDDTAVARTLAALSWDVFGLLSAPLAAFIGGISIAGLRYGAVPHWISFVGLPLAAIMLLAPIPYLSEFFWFGLLAFWPWLLVLSAYMVIRPRLPELSAAEGEG